MSALASRIDEFDVIPLAFSDPPLLNAAGVHEPLALRTLVRLRVGRVVAWGEGRGDAMPPEVVAAVREAVLGEDVFATNRLDAAVDAVLRRVAPGMGSQDRLNSFAPLEVAALDAQGRLLGLPVSELLGGSVRDRVDYSAYLFFKWAGHLGEEPDAWGAALDASGIVRQADALIDRYGFRSIKLKAGALPPALEVESLLALADRHPGLPLRIDPNGAWTHRTAVEVAAELGDVLEYLEDPVLGIEGMSRVHAETGLPLATNMCVTRIEHLRPAVAADAVQIVLSDHHYWGGLQRTRELAATCEAFGLGVSMHSNSHLGISLAAMTHVGSTIRRLDYACDTHYPWNREDDIVVPGVLEIVDGAVAVPDGPGLGVEIDEERVAALHRRHREAGRSVRDDGGYMRRVDPAFSDVLPRY
jgi:glucarate dehydratase